MFFRFGACYVATTLCTGANSVYSSLESCFATLQGPEFSVGSYDEIATQSTITIACLATVADLVEISGPTYGVAKHCTDLGPATNICAAVPSNYYYTTGAVTNPFPLGFSIQY